MNIDLQAFYEKAIADNDKDRERMVLLLRQVIQLMPFNVDRALSYLHELDLLLKRVDEPCWDLLCANLRWELLMMKNEFSKMLDVAAKATVEARKPRYDVCEERIDTHVSLVTSYMYLDPLGYREKILDALTYLLKQNLPSYILVDIYTRWSFVETINENFSEAEHYANLALQSVDYDNDHSALISCYTSLCALAMQQKQFDKAIEYVVLGMKSTADLQFKPYLCQFLGWGTLAYQKIGDEGRARLFHVMLEQYLSEAEFDMPYVVPGVLSAYCIEIDDLDQALDYAWQMIELAKHSPYAMAFSHLVLCCVLGARNELHAQQLNETHMLIQKLIAPQKLLDKLEQIQQGNYDITSM